jgi:hypothetical protein
MNIDEVKVKLVHDILEIQDEQLLIDIENLLLSISDDNEKFVPMSIEEMNVRIEKSERDFEDRKYIPTDDLITKYSK